MLKSGLVIFVYLAIFFIIVYSLLCLFLSGGPFAQKVTQCAEEIFRSTFYKYLVRFVTVLCVGMVIGFFVWQFWKIPSQWKSFAEQNGFEYGNLLQIWSQKQYIRGSHNGHAVFLGYVNQDGQECCSGELCEDFQFWVQVPGMPEDLYLHRFLGPEKEMNDWFESLEKETSDWFESRGKKKPNLLSRRNWERITMEPEGSGREYSIRTDQKESVSAWLNKRRQDILRDFLSDHNYCLSRGGVVFTKPDLLKNVKDLNAMLRRLEAVCDQLR